MSPVYSFTVQFINMTVVVYFTPETIKIHLKLRILNTVCCNTGIQSHDTVMI